MIKAKTQRSSVFVNTPFVTPLLDWNGVAPRFFEMLHEVLTSEFVVNPREFSVTTGNSLGDVAAKYNIFGTPNSINFVHRQVNN